MLQKKLVPPDGGWAWVVMFAFALNNLVFIPILQTFGMIFKDAFTEMNLSATDATIIISTNAAFGMIMGLVNGPLIKRYGYRKVSLAGAVLITSGIISTAFATKMAHFLITYGLITSFGIGVGMSSYMVALSSYFVKNRSKATGFAFTITGFGPILMPQLLSFLLYTYDVRGVMMIVGAIASHTLVAALLLQPVKWHMKVEMVEVDDEEIEETESRSRLLENDRKESRPLRRNSKNQRAIVDSNMSIDHDDYAKSIYGFDTLSTQNKAGGIVNLGRKRSASTSYNNSKRHFSQGRVQLWASVPSINVENSVTLFDERRNTIKEESSERPEVSKSLIPSVYNPELSVKHEQPHWLTKFLDNVVNFFDLTLLKDYRYLSILLGTAMVVFAEMNFSLLTPFILADIGLTTQDIAVFLSVLSSCDLIFRFVSPFVGDYFKKSPRIMYLISLAMLIVGRYCLILFSQLAPLIGVAAGLGISKGIRTVYVALILPNYVPIERLASASGLQMVTNGLLLLSGGPLLGVIRDVTGSYTKCIHVMNVLTIATMVLWTLEMIYYNIKERKKEMRIVNET